MHQFFKGLVALQTLGLLWTQHATPLQKVREVNYWEFYLLRIAIQGPIDGSSGAIKVNHGR